MHPRAIRLGTLDGEQVIACAHCHGHNQVPRLNPPRRTRIRAVVPQKTIRFQGDEGVRAARIVEARAQLEHISVSKATVRAILAGNQANPHIGSAP